MFDLTGQIISHYKILGQIGQGGMATVYQAMDLTLDRTVAIKLIQTDKFSSASLPALRLRFEREAKALAKLSHGNIVKVFEYGEYEGAPYLVMEYLPHGTLKARMGQPMPFQQAARTLLPIVRALAYAHSMGVVHRDVKPANILFSQLDDPILTDFGIVKLVGVERDQTLTVAGVGIGTPEYMASEQWLGKEITGRVDVYSLGIIFFELVTGRKPYDGETPGQLMDQHCHSPLPSPRQFVPDLPAEVEHVIYKALAKQPQQRYPDMQALAAALQGLLELKLAARLGAKPAAPTAKPVSRGDTTAPRKVQSPPPPPDNNLTINELLESKPPVKTHLKLPGKKLGLAALALLGLLVWLVCWKVIPTILENVQDASTTRTAITSTQTEAARLTEIATAWTDSPTLTPMLTYNLVPPDCAQLGQKWVSPIDGTTLRCVPAGIFSMGKTSGYQNEGPVHEVNLAAYWIDQTEVTNGQYAKCVADGMCESPGSGHYTNTDYANHPVVNVTWYDAEKYCTWADRELPSEAQWEKAARGPSGRIYPWGNEWDCNKANSETSCDDYSGTSPVGSFAAGSSPYGALDLAGNAWEWVADWYKDEYYETYPTDGWPDNPTGPVEDTGYKVLRGGSWYDSKDLLRSPFRYWKFPDSRGGNFLGFRCALSQP